MAWYLTCHEGQKATGIMGRLATQAEEGTAHMSCQPTGWGPEGIHNGCGRQGRWGMKACFGGGAHTARPGEYWLVQ